MNINETVANAPSATAESERERRPYTAPDLDTAPGELMDTIRGTGGGCGAPSGAADECNSN